jgi:hypothetical protein
MFPGVKTPGYSQDVPPGHRNVAAATSARQATRFIGDAFKGISRPPCPAMNNPRSNSAIRISCFVILPSAMSSQSPTSLPLWEIEFRVADITSRQQGIPREKVTPSSRIIEDLNIDSLDLVVQTVP